MNLNCSFERPFNPVIPQYELHFQLDPLTLVCISFNFFPLERNFAALVALPTMYAIVMEKKSYRKEAHNTKAHIFCCIGFSPCRGFVPLSFCPRGLLSVWTFARVVFVRMGFNLCSRLSA